MTTSSAGIRNMVEGWLASRIDGATPGLPEFDDRLNLWRVALVAKLNRNTIVGEVRVADGKIVFQSDLKLSAQRIKATTPSKRMSPKNPPISFRPSPSRIVLGNSAEVLGDFPPDTAQLIFTSPPYFNAKPECYESSGYTGYLHLLETVFSKCHDILSEGRFLVVNTSPVLIRRPHRNASSRRIPITFDIHRVLDKIGFEFVDDIIWQKPEGAGWHLGRGRRFAADRQPLQYKPVTVTENVIVYRKRTDKLIDWNIRNHPDPSSVRASLIDNDYEKTNVWKLSPSSHKEHPCVFPDALAERIIRYYSFIGDTVVDPFAGSGTTGRVAGFLERRFLLVENSLKYFNTQLHDPSLMKYHPIIYDHQYFAGIL